MEGGRLGHLARPKSLEGSIFLENCPLGTDEPVEFEKQPVEVQDCRRVTDRFKEFIEYTPI